VARIPFHVEHRTEFDREFRQAYLGGHIRYDLGPGEKAGLERFRRELEHHTGRPTWEPGYF
jgi:predicted solute-binding protein